jgi:hypothetical protein
VSAPALGAGGNVGAGTAFWDLDTDTQVDFPPENPFGFVAFEASAAGALLVGDQSGLYRSPVGRDTRAPVRWRIGPPQALGMRNSSIGAWGWRMALGNELFLRPIRRLVQVDPTTRRIGMAGVEGPIGQLPA